MNPDKSTALLEPPILEVRRTMSFLRMVPRVGIEPTHPCGYKVLSLAHIFIIY